MLTQEECPPETAQAAEDEADLVAALKDGSEQAWTQVYDQHYRPIYRYALVRTSNPTVAEDLAATVFLEALKGINSYSYRGRPILAWLYRIARNVVSDHYKASRRSQAGVAAVASRAVSFLMRRGEPEGKLAEGAGGETSSEGDPAASIEHLDMQDALRRLPESQREVIVLRYYMGLTTPEAAVILGKKERAVYSLHARAMESLRRHLGPTYKISSRRRVVSASSADKP
jgi:RNA polymerase sigma-70 factor (ECF subfamily)